MSRQFSNVGADEWNQYDRLIAFTASRPDRRGEVVIPCPECGKSEGQFSFSPNGAHCFSCGYSAGLTGLAAKLGVREGGPVMQSWRPAKRKEIPNRWAGKWDELCEIYLSAADRVRLWKEYKPLRVATLERWQLGVGVLPGSRCKRRRLIVPVFEGSELVGIRGRLIAGPSGESGQPCGEGCKCPKWLTAGGSKTVLFNAGALVVGQVEHVIIVENMIDCVLGDEEREAGRLPGVVMVASSSGASSWEDDWTELIRAAQPKTVTAWLDNDYPGGLPNRQTRNAMRREWLERNPNATPPELTNGERLVQRLSASRLPVAPYEWPAGTPPKTDMGAFLIQRREALA